MQLALYRKAEASIEKSKEWLKDQSDERFASSKGGGKRRGMLTKSRTRSKNSDNEQTITPVAKIS